MSYCYKCGYGKATEQQYCPSCGTDPNLAAIPRNRSPHSIRSTVLPSSGSARQLSSSGKELQPGRLVQTNPPLPVSSARQGNLEGLRASSGQAKIGQGALEEMHSCQNCGAACPKRFVFCVSCGTRLAKDKQPPPSWNQKAGNPHQPTPLNTVPPALPRRHQQDQARPAQMTVILPNGKESEKQLLGPGETIIGRNTGGIFRSDPCLSPRHARIVVEPYRVILEDLGSLNGVFIRLANHPEEIFDEDIFRIGTEIIRFNSIVDSFGRSDATEILGSPNPGYWGRLTLISHQRRDGSAFPLLQDEIILGREEGDICFPDDYYISKRHAKIRIDERSSVMLEDLDSSNGTFVRITSRRAIIPDTIILMGSQQLRIGFP